MKKGEKACGARAGHRPTRRALLRTATAVAAGAATGLPPAVAETSPAPAAFGAPLAELHFPAGVLSAEQKAAMIRGVTDVLVNAMRLPADHAVKLWVQIFETAAGGWGAAGQVVVPRAK